MGYNFKNLETILHKMNIYYYIDNVIQMCIVTLNVLQKRIGYRQKIEVFWGTERYIFNELLQIHMHTLLHYMFCGHGLINF